MSKHKHAIEAVFQRAVRAQAAGHAGEAERLCHEVLAAVPTHADSHHLLGVLALQAGQPQRALHHIDRAIAAAPRAGAYHLNRAAALHRLGQAEAAIAAAHEALRLDRTLAEAHQLLGHVLSDLGRSDEALAAYQEAARRKPGLFDIHNNLGVAQRNAGRLEDAERSLREALRREPGEPGITANLSGVLKEMGRVAEAEIFLRDALQANPEDPRLRFNLALLQLLLGNFVDGWRGYEARARAGAVTFPPFPQPCWMGEDLKGRTLLVHAEQGLGTIIQFSRYLPLLARRLGGSGHVIFQVPRPLARLLGSLQAAPPIIAAGAPVPPFDLVCPLLSLPDRFATTPETVPRGVPYLAAEPVRVAAWRQRLGSQGFKVGVAWQGNPKSQAELGRPVPLEHFLPLGRLPGVRLICLQRDRRPGELEDLPPGSRIETLGDQFDAGPDAFLDSAAVMMCLDLVIASDTNIAHLAGALARPVWVALQQVPDWRWMLHRPDSPWYPTMRLFRQTRRGDWSGVFAEIATALARLIETGAAA